MDTDSEVIDVDSGVDSDHDESEDDGTGEASTSEDVLFSAPQQVFIVRTLSKAIVGFRPSVMCEGYLAKLSKSSAGYILAPLGRDQQLSFKYEPPSPKFSRKRPSCLSYRLQLLHGSQFLYSLRGLPKVLRCQRAAHALEWGPVHLVFAAAADLDTFLATLKYVEVEEMTPEAEDGQQGGGGGGAAAEAHRQQQPSAGTSAAAAGPAGVDGDGGGGGGGGSDSRGREPSIGGAGMQWATATARLLAAQRSADGADGTADAAAATAAAGGAAAAAAATAAAEEAGGAAAAAGGAAAAAGSAAAAGGASEEPDEAQAGPGRPDLPGLRRALPLGVPVLAAGTVVLLVAVAAAFFLGGGPGRWGRKSTA